MITVSVVSHGQEPLARALLHSLAARHDPQVSHVVLTYNLPASPIEAPVSGWPFRLTEIHNPQPHGFGANHNRAFQHCDSEWFCVLNPDIEITEAGFWENLAEAGAAQNVALVYPRLLNADGTVQENEREAVTPLALLRRHLLRRGQQRADWASAALWLVRSAAWRSIGGFDERFFMYCEDTDFCLRLRLGGWNLARAQASAVHAGGYASRRSLRGLGWHVRSLLRLWTQPALRLYLAGRAKARQ